MPPPVQIILGKFIAATSIAKLKARGMSGIKLLDIHNSSVSKNLCWNFCLFFNFVCLFVFSIIQIISAFVFVFGSSNPIQLTSVMVKWWICWWLNVLTMRMMGNVTSTHGREEIGQKASTAQSYKDVGALNTPRFRVFHILQLDS